MKTTLKLSVKSKILAAACLMLALASCKKETKLPPESLSSATALKTNAIGTNGPKGVCYVEVNSNDLRNVAKYTLTNGSPLFDIGIIFAANINFNTSSRTAELFFNPQVTNVLSNRDTYVKPLQDKGIKVLLSILGNHQGAGMTNFTSMASAQAFAQQLSNAVSTYGLDGIDFDDEYSDYGNNGTTQPNDSSFVFLVTALRELMPSKIISFYFYGPAASRLSYQGVTVGSKVNYSWNAIYGTYSTPAVPGLAKSNLGPAAIDITATSAGTAASLATRTVSDGYGIYLYYNLPNADSHTYLSNISNALYGFGTVYN
ncbi:Glycosyl hydrolases family 18 [Pedobacter westerhofensis]|uniref:Glycosyl hydrolases family 18 n=1 Tax=Pedobacter westerhofensis TaxID=425512 RepID=A0A521DGX6_9SPHI|nr:endo-beta-N-acetylglucosaminidase H [Pedobacter westerhofensis]SMO70969.1 Glycosyl hydrolases family 18 [Pedobacter westerhofensis]